eukprot:15481698-Heterocapsa_arctica.AAC.1
MAAADPIGISVDILSAAANIHDEAQQGQMDGMDLQMMGFKQKNGMGPQMYGMGDMMDEYFGKKLIDMMMMMIIGMI